MGVTQLTSRFPALWQADPRVHGLAAYAMDHGVTNQLDISAAVGK